MTLSLIAAVNRRHLIQAAVWGGLGYAGLLAPRAQANSGDRRRAFAIASAPFNGPLDRSGAARFNGKLETTNIAVRGKIPADLRGTLYRNGAGRFELGCTSYSHWLDGDGMIQAFNFADGKASHLGVLLSTPKLIEEEKAGRFLYSAFGTEMDDSKPVATPDTVNSANTSVLSMNGGQDLFALWEGGSATQLNPKTLAVPPVPE